MQSSNAWVRFLDRMVKGVLPVAVESFAPPPRQIAEDLWVVVRQLRLSPALRLPTHMTLMRLPNGAVVVHSPVRLDPALLAATNQIGAVAAILVPNSFHYAYAADWVRQFPAARFYCAPGLPARVPGLPAATELSDAAPDLWSGEIDQIVYAPPGPFSEVVFRHRRSQTLILSDLAFNMVAFDSPAQRIGWRLMGVPPDFGPSRTARLTLLRDRRVSRPYLHRMAEWKFERLIVAHGEVIESDAHAVFERGFAAFL